MEKNILFVESSDSFIGRMIGVTILKKPDYSVIAKAKGESDAIEKLRANGPDLDLVIIHIVEKDDYQTIKAIREIDREIPIIAIGPAYMCTPDGMIDRGTVLWDVAIEMGANDTCTQPFSPDMLLSRVKKLIGEP